MKCQAKFQELPPIWSAEAVKLLVFFGFVSWLYSSELPLSLYVGFWHRPEDPVAIIRPHPGFAVATQA